MPRWWYMYRVKDYCMLTDALGKSNKSSTIHIILAQLQRFIQITTAKMNLAESTDILVLKYNVGLPMSIISWLMPGYCIVVCMQL